MRHKTQFCLWRMLLMILLRPFPVGTYLKWKFELGRL